MKTRGSIKKNKNKNNWYWRKSSETCGFQVCEIYLYAVRSPTMLGKKKIQSFHKFS